MIVQSEIVVYLRSPEGVSIQGDGQWLGDNGDEGIQFTQHKECPLIFCRLAGYDQVGVELSQQSRGATTVDVPLDNIALVLHLVGR